MSHRLTVGVFAFFFLFLPRLAMAQTPAAEYALGIKLYQEGKWAEAAQHFELVLKEEPKNHLALYNLGLCESKAGHWGKAIGLWRAAFSRSPLFRKSASAIEFAQSQLKVKALPHQISTWETFRAAIVIKIPRSFMLGVTAASLLAFGLLAIRARSKSSSMLPAYSAATVLLFGIVLSAASLYDFVTPRATILPQKIEARSGPGLDQSPVFELYEGLEVIIDQKFQSESGTWYQVTYPGGQTGWLPSTEVLITSGRSL